MNIGFNSINSVPNARPNNNNNNKPKAAFGTAAGVINSLTIMSKKGVGPNHLELVQAHAKGIEVTPVFVEQVRNIVNNSGQRTQLLKKVVTTFLGNIL